MRGLLSCGHTATTSAVRYRRLLKTKLTEFECEIIE